MFTRKKNKEQEEANEKNDTFVNKLDDDNAEGFVIEEDTEKKRHILLSTNTDHHDISHLHHHQDHNNNNNNTNTNTTTTCSSSSSSSGGGGGEEFSSNKIQTTKYTFYNFIPKNLMFQFSNIANIYFLMLICLQAIPQLNIVAVEITALPLVIILSITASKDAFEDWKRLQADQSVNTSETYHCENLHKNVKKRSQFLSLCSNFMLNPIHFIVKLFKRKAPDLPEEVEPSDYLEVDSATTTINNNTIHDKKHQPQYAWKKLAWQDVKVGQYLLLRNHDSIPADIVILSTSEEDATCFVETKNLDGETNLKVRRGIQSLQHIQTPADCSKIEGRLEIQPPSNKMYEFNGYAVLKSSLNKKKNDDDNDDDDYEVSNGEEHVPLSINSVLLRGCVLRNTKWVIGVVVATGSDTKLMLNSGKTPTKKSRIDRQLNPQILLNFMLLFAMCLVCGILGAIYQLAFNYVTSLKTKENSTKQFNIPVNDQSYELSSAPFSEPAVIALLTFASCMIIFQNIIPIAIYISVDVAKTFQSYLIYVDADLVDPETGTASVARSWNLCDDLGQIEYIFSDKTGTLTCNVMEFRKCSINGVIYGGSFVSQANAGAAKRNGGDDSNGKVGGGGSYEKQREKEEADMRKNMGELFDQKYIANEPLCFVDSDLHEHIKVGRDGAEGNESPNEMIDQATSCVHFFTLLAVCHTVLVERPDEKDANTLAYKAQSPDEAALVAAARDVGFAFLSRDKDEITVDVLGDLKTFTILNVLEFNSDRKRMSVIVRIHGEENVLLLTKGADSVIFSRLDKQNPRNSEKFLDVTSAHLATFADDGLRTLCLAYRIIPAAEYEAWVKDYEAATLAIDDRDAKIDTVSSMIESRLVLMGATAIEDKLQDGVPDTIATLSKSGIKIWVLTGDKMETAINIGFATNLLQNNMLTIIIKGAASQESTLKQIKDALDMFWDRDGNPLRACEAHALIIDGETLTFALDDVCRDYLLELACRCKSVVCCRVSPLQKALVVKLVRKGLSAMCLAIGDGANDVSMIQEADVGIGISGKEGMQAVMSSDYAISQFRFLKRLLLVHGRWSYMRTAELILNYFYKNIVWLFVLFWYQFDSAFTGDIITDFTYGMFYNTIFSLLPNMVLGMFDQDVNDEISLQVPELYQKGIKQQLYNMERFWFYVFDGMYQSLVCYYLGSFIFSDATLDPRGFDSNREELGTFLAFYCIITVNLYLGFNNFSWNWVTHVSLWATIVVFAAYVVLYLMFFRDESVYALDGLVPKVFLNPTFYLSLVLAIIISLFPRFIVKYTQQYVSPTDTDIVQEYQACVWKSGDVVNLDIIHSPTTDASKSSFLGASDSEGSSSSNGGGILKSLSNLSLGVSSKQGSESTLSNAPAAQPPSARRKSTILPSSMFFSSNAPQYTGQSSSPTASSSSSSGSPTDSKSAARLGKKIIQPLSSLGKKTGEFVKSVPKLLRIPSMTPSWSKGGGDTKASNVVYMGSPVHETNNTGFAFSHAEGMEEILLGRAKSGKRKPRPLTYPPQLSTSTSSIPNVAPIIIDTDEYVAPSIDVQAALRGRRPTAPANLDSSDSRINENVDLSGDGGTSSQ